jgi:hypothetical protein
MKQMQWKFKMLAAIALVAAVMLVQSCGEDDPTPIELSTITAGTVDLNGATAPTGVPTDATITITFNTNVDASTANSTNIKLTRDYDDADIPLTITTAGNVVTVDPTNTLNGGALYVLSVTEGLKSSDGLALTALNRSFTTAGSFAPDGVIAHWTFEDSPNSVVGSFNAAPAPLTKDVTYVASRNAGAAKAASFNGTTTIIEIPNGDQLMANGDFAVSFWVKVDGTKTSHFVFGLGGSYGFQFEVLGGAWEATDKGVKLATRYRVGTSPAGAPLTEAEDTWWNGQPNGWVGSLFAKEVATGIGPIFKDTWAHVVCTYDKESKIGTMYVNGEKARAWDFDQWPDGAKKNATGVAFAGNTTGGGNNLAIGFIQASGNRIISDTWADPANPDNNHFKGQLDDLRIFNTAITEQEILLMYNSEK